MSIELTVNGSAVSVAAAGDTPLLDVLRNHLDLKGSRYGCGLEQCGSCMVVIDGKPEYSCAREISTVAGLRVETVESLAGHPLRQAFLEEQAGQCGYCLSGILMSAKALLIPTKTRAGGDRQRVGRPSVPLRRSPENIARGRKAAAALRQGGRS